MAVRKRKINNKYLGVVINGAVEIVKATNGNPIEEAEPIFLFRGQDLLSIPVLEHYVELCKANDASPQHLHQVQAMLDDFKAFAANFPDRMKMPEQAEPASTVQKDNPSQSALDAAKKKEQA